VTLLISTNATPVSNFKADNKRSANIFGSLTSVLNQKSIEEVAMWGGTPWSAGRHPRRPLFRLIAKPDQGVRRGRGRPPHRELCGELLIQDTRCRGPAHETGAIRTGWCSK